MLQIRDIRKEYKTGSLVQKALDGVSLSLRDNEFVAILEGHDYENRIALTEKLKSDFTTSFEQEDRDPWLRFSAAVGMAENASDDTTYELVFKRADKAMYDDKAAFKKAHAV